MPELPNLETLRKQHPVRKIMADALDWGRAVRDCMLSDPATREKFLVRGTHETNGDWRARINLSHYDAELPSIINRALDKAFKDEPRRLSPDENGDVPTKLQALADWAEHVTPDGRSIGELTVEATENGCWDRLCVALIDYAALAKGEPVPETQAQADAQGIGAPYVVLFPAAQVLDWRISRAGLLEYIKLVSPVYPDAEGGSVVEYREITAKGIRVWRHVRKPGETREDDGKVEDGGFAEIPATDAVRQAGRLPVAVYREKPIDAVWSRFRLGEALEAERCAMLYHSDVQWGDYNVGHPTLKLKVRQPVKDLALGATSVIKLDPGGPGKGGETVPPEDAEWLEVKGDSLKHLSAERDAAKARIYAKAGVQGRAVKAVTGESQPAANSGRQVENEFQVDEAQLLGAIATRAEAFEVDLLRIAALKLKVCKTWEEALVLIEVNYNTENFAIDSADKTLTRTQSAGRVYGADSTLVKGMMRRGARAVHPNATEDFYKKVEAEITAGKSGMTAPDAPDLMGGAPGFKPKQPKPAKEEGK